MLLQRRRMKVIRRWGRLFGRRRIATAITCYRTVGAMGLSDAQWVATAASAAKPKLVHEVLEGTAVASCQSAGQGARNFFRGAVQERCGLR